MRQQEHLQNISSIESFQKKNNKPLLVLVAVVIILVVWSIFAVRSENRHREIAGLYAQAFVLYHKIDLSKPYTDSQSALIKQTIEALSLPADFYGNFTEKYMALTQIALLYNHQGKPEDAISFLEQVRKAPKSFISKPQAMVLLARIYEKEQKTDWAIKIYEELETQTNGETLNFVRYQLGLLYSSNKNTLKQSIKTYNKIEKASPLKSLAERNIFMLNAISNSLESKKI